MGYGYPFEHPIGNYRRPRAKYGCMIPLLVIGLIIGGFFYLWFSFRSNDSVTSVEDNDYGKALEDIQTSAAMMGIDDEPANVPFTTIEPSSDSSSATNQPVTTEEVDFNERSNLTIERRIYFPNADTFGQIVPVRQVPGGWDVSTLQDLIGHLEGTSWLGDAGNTVLAGHFEDEIGQPGPFRYLYVAKVGDRIMIQEGADNPLQVYEVREVFSTSPEDLEVLRHTNLPRLTLITCDAWNPDRETYEDRLVVVAEPIGIFGVDDLP